MKTNHGLNRVYDVAGGFALALVLGADLALGAKGIWDNFYESKPVNPVVSRSVEPASQKKHLELEKKVGSVPSTQAGPQTKKNPIEHRVESAQEPKVTRPRTSYEEMISLYGKDTVDLVAKHEGYREFAYTDTTGNLTVGYGCNLDASGAKKKIESIGLNYGAVRAKRQGVTRDQAFALMKKDMATAHRVSDNYLGNILGSVDQRVIPVTTDMAYNLNSKLYDFKGTRKALVEKDYLKASKNMLDSKWARQTKTRAVEDAKRIASISESYRSQRRNN